MVCTFDQKSVVSRLVWRFDVQLQLSQRRQPESIGRTYRLIPSYQSAKSSRCERGPLARRFCCVSSWHLSAIPRKVLLQPRISSSRVSRNPRNYRNRPAFFCSPMTHSSAGTPTRSGAKHSLGIRNLARRSARQRRQQVPRSEAIECGRVRW